MECGNPAHSVDIQLSGSSQRGRPVSGRPADQGLALAGAGSLEQPSLREAQIALRSEDEMVVHGNVQEPPGVDELPRDGAVIRAWRGVAAGVVMGHDEIGRASCRERV